MPVCFLLQLMSRAQKRSLIHKFADQLQAHRQPGCIKAARNRQPRQPRQIDGIGKDVVEVHRNRILGFCAERERGGRAGRTNNYVALLKSGFEILGDNAPDFLRFEVVRVVIASRECVGTNQYSTFDLLAEPFVGDQQIDLATPAQPGRKVGEAVRATRRLGQDVRSNAAGRWARALRATPLGIFS